MSSQATVLTTVRIDVSPTGVSLTIEGLDTDLAELMAAAGTYSAGAAERFTVDTSSIVISSTKQLQFVDKTP